MCKQSHTLGCLWSTCGLPNVPELISEVTHGFEKHGLFSDMVANLQDGAHDPCLLVSCSCRVLSQRLVCMTKECFRADDAISLPKLGYTEVIKDIVASG